MGEINLNNQKNIEEFEKYLLSKNSSNSTIQSYIRTVKQFLELLNKNPKDITIKDIERFKLHVIQVKQYDVNTLIPKYCAINTYMEFLNKPLRIKPPRKRVKNKVPFTIEEIKQLFHISQDDLRDNALLKVFYYGQLRRNEVINLNVEDVDFQRQKLRINHGKGNQCDEVNIHPDALQSIANYLRVRNVPKIGYEKALFLSREGRRISRADINTTIKKYAQKTGIQKRAYPHLFRISSITHMAEKGLNLEEIRRQSRHKRYDTLQSYVQMSDQHVKESYMKAMSLDTKPEKPMTKATSNPENIDQTISSADIELQLLQRLARGEISQEVYVQAINSLKSRIHPFNFSYY
jgi:site-specific recombinase XerD